MSGLGINEGHKMSGSQCKVLICVEIQTYVFVCVLAMVKIL